MNGNDHVEEVDAKLIQETLELLSNVTYVRTSIDRLTFECPPSFIEEESRHAKSPRNRGQVYLTYLIPALSKLSPRSSGRTVKVVAKDVSDRTALFFDKNVALCRITPAIIDNWAAGHCEIKFFYTAPRKRSSIFFAKCSIPMSKILVLPFSLDTTVQLEMTSDYVHCRGYLKLCIQLGSRLQHFMERVEPMRNPTTCLSPLSFRKPSVSKKAIQEQGSEELAEPENQHYYVEKEDGEIFPEEREANETECHHRCYALEEDGISKDKREKVDWAEPDIEQTLRHNIKSHERFSGRRSPIDVFDRRKILLDRDYKVRSPISYHLRHGETSDFSNRRRQAYGEYSWATNLSNPYIHPVDKAPEPLDLIGYSSTTSALSNLRAWRDNRNAISSFDAKKEDELAHTHDAKSTSAWAGKQQSADARKHTVAERLKTKNAPASEPSLASTVRSNLPPASSGGLLLQVTVCRAKHLPLVKSRRSGLPIKPSCYVTYRNNEHIFASNTVSNSTKPVWKWTTQLFVPNDRKNIVFKIWHKEDGGADRSRVLGFVSAELPTKPIIDPLTYSYDIMDLARASSGQLKVSFEPPSSAPNDACESRSNNVAESEKLFNDFDSSSKSSSPDKIDQSRPGPLEEALLIDFDDASTNFRRPISSSVTVNSQQKTIVSVDKAANTCSWTGNDERRRDSFDQFVDLTSRSFLADKLRHTVDELSGLINRLNKRSSSNNGLTSLNS